MRREKGITLIALIITIIVMLILAGVTLTTFTGEGSIIKNAETAVGEYNNKIINEQETLNEVIEYIKNDGNVDIEESGISISATVDTTGLTKTVTVTVVGKADYGVKSFTSTAGDSKTYSAGTKEIVETCNITENGIYIFTIEDINGKTASKGILIENILEGTIQMQVDKTMPTKDNVTVTVTWPSGSEKGTKEIKVGNNSWQVASGNTSKVEATENCTVVARVSNSTGEVTQASITISNIDKAYPIVTATTGTETITEGDSKEISSYFNYSANGKAEITSVKYTDTSDENKVVTNTNTLSVGTHIIKCTVTKETGLSSSVTKTIVVEKSVPVDEDGLATENVTIKPDHNSDLQITIPAGFAPAILATGTLQSEPGEDGSVASIIPYEEWNNITTEDINKGIVIVDNGITYDNGQLTGTTPDFNEYVWVPIPDSNNFKSTAWNVNGSQQSIAIAPTTDEEKQNKYWDYSTTAEYTNMLASVEHYKGFYIGRYEGSQGENNIAQSKRNISTWTNVPQTTAITACTNNTKTPNMHLIYGIEWDSTLNWLIGNATISSSVPGETKTMTIDDIQTDSRSWGNYINSTGDAEANSGSKQNTGYSEYWKANNIYDLAGNVYEWTQEKYSTGTYGAFRGGSYFADGDIYLVAYRNYSSVRSAHNFKRVP